MDIVRSVIVWIIGIGFMLILFPLTFIIWLLVLPFDRERVITHLILVYQSFLLVKLLPIWKIKAEGREKFKKGKTYVIISNHQSILDILIINSLRYKYKWVSKIENTKVPVLGWYLQMANYITVDRGNEESKVEMLEKSLNFLKKGVSVMLFPEGTRSINNEVCLFKRGAFQLAITARVAILPVMIEGTGGILPKHGMVFSGHKSITVKVLDAVEPDSFNTDNADDLAERFRVLIADEIKKVRSDKNYK